MNYTEICFNPVLIYFIIFSVVLDTKGILAISIPIENSKPTISLFKPDKQIKQPLF